MAFASVTVLNSHTNNPTVISTIEKAAEFILYDWPIVPGGMIASARQACLDALAGKVDERVARDFFIAAAKEAKILVSTT
ncbi:DUF982 domain-containing protein [Phyllobacterium ifriqiyense]|uniref:DUF982 domain-containing protein n=1 Tax=Phyllobacterium ifriqiyense TaxID=314238 RepID=UPI00339B7943